MKSTNRIVATVILAAFLTSTAGGPAYAIVGEENLFIAAQIQLLSQIASAEYLRNTELIPLMIKKATEGLAVANATFSVARDAYRLQKAIREYTSDELIRDVKAGLLKTFPEANDLITEYDEFRMNTDSANEGSDQFFGITTRWDNRVRNHYETVATEMEKSVVFPVLFPKQTIMNNWKASTADQAYVAAMDKSGFADNVNSQYVHKIAMMGLTKDYVAQAKESGNFQAQIQGAAIAEQIEQTKELQIIAVNQKHEFLIKADQKAVLEESSERELIIYQTEKKKAGNNLSDLMGPKANQYIVKPSN